jgi:hypothetical protein
MTHPFAILGAQHPSVQPTPQQIVARKYKVSALRQLADIYTLKLGPNYLTAREYYAHEVYRPDLTQAEKHAFVGELGSTRLNAALQKPKAASPPLTPLCSRDTLTQHRLVSTLTGSQTVSRLRLVTVWQGSAIRVLYALWTIPRDQTTPQTVPHSDGMIGEIDIGSGKVRSMRKGVGTDTQWPTNHPRTGVHLMGAALPHWQSVLDTVRAAHNSQRAYALLGWDLAICPDGARLIGGTANPHHGLYQFATARGILNETFAPVFEEIKAAH